MIYSRNLENLSKPYPDVIDNVIAFMEPMKEIQNFILDSELCAYDIDHNKILPFQTLTQRSRKHITKADLENHVAIFGFDLLYLNDKPLLQQSLYDRRKLLKETFKVVPG